MANSQLQGKVWDIPVKMKDHLQTIFDAYKGPKNVEGWERLRDMLSSDTITYEQMKRIKNFFDNFQGTNKDTTYLLNGGTKVKTWINSKLEHARDEIHGKKEKLKDIGMTNQFQKDQDLSVPSGKIGSHTSELKKVMGEELKKINYIITEIKNNKKSWQMDK
jgi:hypothetical protein